jgi:hypothetical protein
MVLFGTAGLTLPLDGPPSLKSLFFEFWVWREGVGEATEKRIRQGGTKTDTTHTYRERKRGRERGGQQSGNLWDLF